MDARITRASAEMAASESRLHTSLRQTDDTSPDSRMWEACADFEALFMVAMMTAMRGSAPRDGLLRVSRAEEMFREQLDYELARGMVRRSSVGIATMLYQQLSPAL